MANFKDLSWLWQNYQSLLSEFWNSASKTFLDCMKLSLKRQTDVIRGRILVNFWNVFLHFRLTQSPYKVFLNGKKVSQVVKYFLACRHVFICCISRLLRLFCVNEPMQHPKCFFKIVIDGIDLVLITLKISCVLLESQITRTLQVLNFGVLMLSLVFYFLLTVGHSTAQRCMFNVQNMTKIDCFSFFNLI